MAEAGVSGNTFVMDGSRPRGSGRFGDTAALGYEQDGERYDTLTMTGCADCTVAGTSLPYEERPQVELSEATEANLVLLPLAAGAAARRAVLDHGSDDQVCALPSALGDTHGSLPSRQRPNWVSPAAGGSTVKSSPLVT